MSRKYDIIVIGAGAAGVMAAGAAAGAGAGVLLCEKMEKPQRKVRITGKGRCNLTNMRPAGEFLAKVRAGAVFFARPFEAFDNRRTVDFFESIGVPLIVERGERVFPASSKAWDIADGHVAWCRRQGVEIECNTSVKRIEINNGQVAGVTLESRGGHTEEVAVKAVIIATGGLSYPATGSTGDGLMLAHDLGHTIEEVRPSLTPLETDPAAPKELNRVGLRNISASLYVDSQKAAEEFGELEFTPTGVSGPVILRLSRMAVDAVIEERRVELVVDLKPALSPEKIKGRLERETAALPGRATVGTLMGKMLPSAMINFFLRQAKVAPSTSASLLDHASRDRIISALKALRFTVTDYRPFTEAIVTAGGVATSEVDPATMQSKLVKGLFFAGEVLDVDADTGGYNLQIAYSTGHAAGLGAAGYLKI